MIIVNIVRQHFAIQFGFFILHIIIIIIYIKLTDCTHLIIIIILRFTFVMLNQFRDNKNYNKLVTRLSRYYTDIYILGKLSGLKNMQYHNMV